MPQESWKPVVGFEGSYLVSSFGRVKSTRKGRSDRILKQCPDRWGYLKLGLCAGGIRVNVYAHRLVAESFIPNPGNLSQVNHIDGDKPNNREENLEWVSSADNNLHACRVLLKRVRPVVAQSTNSPVSLCYPSLQQAIEDGFHRGSIQRCIEGRRRRHGGYIWHDCLPLQA